MIDEVFAPGMTAMAAPVRGATGRDRRDQHRRAARSARRRAHAATGAGAAAGGRRPGGDARGVGVVRQAAAGQGVRGSGVLAHPRNPERFRFWTGVGTSPGASCQVSNTCQEEHHDEDRHHSAPAGPARSWRHDRQRRAMVAEAAGAGASLIVFPESFVPGYPSWYWRLAAGKDGAVMGQLHARAGQRRRRRRRRPGRTVRGRPRPRRDDRVRHQ